MFYLGECEEFFLVVTGQVLYIGRRRYELNRVGLAYDLAYILGLEIFLADIARLIVEEAM